ncbi:MAG TPA: hypothetical protein PK573_08345 [Spirochaetota bacterium]|nr:hypothetical protein [Spirochaetota bacterium]
MQNVEFQRTGDKLIITVDLKKFYGKSPSGKSTIIASTDGNIRVPDTGDRTVKMGLSVYEQQEVKA